MKAKKFTTQPDAIEYATAQNGRHPEYDWYVIALPVTTDLWYVQRGGDYPQLYNGARVIWINGEFTDRHVGMRQVDARAAILDKRRHP